MIGRGLGWALKHSTFRWVGLTKYLFWYGRLHTDPGRRRIVRGRVSGRGAG